PGSICTSVAFVLGCQAGDHGRDRSLRSLRSRSILLRFPVSFLRFLHVLFSFSSAQSCGLEGGIGVMSGRRRSIAAALFVLGMPWTAHAQPRIASLGKGWLLGRVGSITSAPGEVISGSNSIKGSGSADTFLFTDPAIIKFAANQTYTMTVNYRILTSSPG